MTNQTDLADDRIAYSRQNLATHINRVADGDDRSAGAVRRIQQEVVALESLTDITQAQREAVLALLVEWRVLQATIQGHLLSDGELR